MPDPIPQPTSPMTPEASSALSDIHLPSVPLPRRFPGAAEPAEERTVHRDYGRYCLVRDHAQGGLGKVSLAEDPRLGRTVALKEIRPDRPADSALIARFVNEAAITGQLEHPGIVPVYTLDEHPDGQPYYAMRFIQGRTLTEAILAWHRAPSPLEFRELLQRFVSVCQTMAYAHSKGVIHRDLKPDNIMLGAYGETLVLDWGLAKVLSKQESLPEPTDKETGRQGDKEKDTSVSKSPPLLSSPSPQAQTREGTVIGTPSFMSPEQACSDHARTGPLSDVYALGAVLYALLTGIAPFDGTPMQIIHWLRRGSAPKPVRSVKPEMPTALAAICDRAMAVIPADRYADAQELAHDVERWLADEPVSAWQEPWHVRSRRWLRRHRTLTTGAGAALLMLLLSMVVLAGMAQHYTEHDLQQAQASEAALRAERDRTRQERDKAEQALAGSRAMVAFLGEQVLGAPRPTEVFADAQGPTVSLRAALDAAAPKIPDAFAGQPLLEAELSAILGTTYLYLGAYDQAEPLWRQALRLRQRHLEADHPDTLCAAQNVGVALLGQGRLEEAHQALADVEAILRRRYGPDHPETLALLHQLGAVHMLLGNRADAETVLKRVLDARRRAQGDEHPGTLRTWWTLAALYTRMGRYAEAETIYRRILAVRQRALGPDHEETLAALAQLADVLRQRGQAAAAERLARQEVQTRRRLAPDHPNTLEAQRRLAQVLLDLNRGAEAETLLHQTLTDQRRVLGRQHADTLDTLNTLGCLVARQGRPADAETLLREALNGQGQVYGQESLHTLRTMNNLAGVIRDLGRPAEAEDLYRHLLPLHRHAQGPEHPDTLTVLHNLALVLAAQDKHADAEPLLRQALASRRRVLGPEHPHTLSTQACLASLLRELHRYAEAEPLLRDALARRQKQVDPDHPDLLDMESQLADLLYQRGRLGDAEPLLRALLERKRRVLGPEHPDTLATLNTLAQLLCQTKHWEESESLQQTLLAAARRTFGPKHQNTYAITRNLAQVLALQSKHREAETLYRQAWEFYRQHLGPTHTETLTCAARLAETLLAQRKYADAEPLLLERHQALVQNQAAPKEVQGAVDHLIQLYDAWGKPEEAAAWRKKK